MPCVPKCPGAAGSDDGHTLASRAWVHRTRTFRWVVSQAEGESSKEGGQHGPEQSCQGPLVRGVKPKGFNCVWQHYYLTPETVSLIGAEWIFIQHWLCPRPCACAWMGQTQWSLGHSAVASWTATDKNDPGLCFKASRGTHCDAVTEAVAARLTTPSVPLFSLQSGNEKAKHMGRGQGHPIKKKKEVF